MMRVRSFPILLAVWVPLCLAAPAEARNPDPMMRPSFLMQLQGVQAPLWVGQHANWHIVGHSHTNHPAGGLDPWNVYTGAWNPGAYTSTSAMWDFDDATGLAGDSLQGWWPVHLPYRAPDVGAWTDDQRPWTCLDHGNQLDAAPVGAAHPRTFGVVSAWHADPGRAAGHVGWAPLSGSRSMWCGLRQLHDDVVVDPVTHQPFTEQAVEFNGWSDVTAPAPTYRAYPGYGNQWDQVLYRDFDVPQGQALEVRFLYATRLSTVCAMGPGERTGWFHGDPLSLAPGNFISASAAGDRAPRDSFSVYIGCPVNDAACTYSDGSVSPVYDPQRRWFDEVIRFDAPWFELLGVAGAHPADTLSAPESFDAIVPWADPGNGGASVAALYGAAGNGAHRVRLVFRVKTNRTGSDDDAAAGNGLAGTGGSGGRGAVLLDDVAVNGTMFDFEAANGGVDDAVTAGGAWVTPTTASWKTTGKPVAQYLHAVDIDRVNWNDLCGQPGTSTETCHLQGVAASIANEDQGGAIADARWPALTEVDGGFVSPAVDFVTADATTPNEQGITRDMTWCTEDLYLLYEINDAAFVLANTGTCWNFAVQAYPVTAANGHATWSDLTGSPYRLYDGLPGCIPDLQPLASNGMVRTSNANGVPDSVRVYLGITSECYLFGASCNSTDGGYFDNVALVLANRASAPGPRAGAIRSDLWQFFCDAFPVDGALTDNVPAGSAGFDTTTALVKGPVNLAPMTGDIERNDVLADSIVTSAPNGTGTDRAVRVDLVFRILPGPGNYKAVAGRQFPPTAAMPLLRVPTDPVTVVASGDGSFWGEYIANDGAFGTGGGGVVHGADVGGSHPGGRWDYLRWNSARCDTLGTNLFPVAGTRQGQADPEGRFYQSTYHESDPHVEKLGIVKSRCFLVDPSGPPNTPNITCDSTVAAGLAYLGAGAGFDGVFATKAYTKIIPDGLLTPGSHVQYFLRKQLADGTGDVAMVPDTNTICPQLRESNFDGHRWQTFGVLPDRWKDPNFGGTGMACMLLLDNADRRGDELAWASIMDSIGGTASSRWGENDGWHAMGGGFRLDADSNASVPQAFVNRNGQPGSVWERYDVRASEAGATTGSHIGSRYAAQPAGFMAGKGAAIGPRKSWLRTYYRQVAWLTGDLNTPVFGPVPDIGEDDIGTIEDFLATAGGTAQPRQILVQGDGFAEQCEWNYGVETDFLNNYLYCDLRDASYSDLTPSLLAWPDLLGSAALVPGGTIYAVRNDCRTLNDVLTLAPAGASMAASYQAVGPNAPYVAGVEHVATASANWHSILLGWDLQNTYGRYGRSGACGMYRLSYYDNLFAHGFGSTCGTWAANCGWNGCCGLCCGDVPGDPHVVAPVNFLRIGNTPTRGGHAIAHFGTASAGHVRVVLYDLAGRRVRTLADESFAAGPHDRTWDGLDDSGQPVGHGVYFARIELPDGSRINGRIVILD